MSSETIWIGAVLRDAPEFLRARDPHALIARAASWVALQLERCRDPEFAAKFQRHCPVDDCLPDAYLQRELEVGGGVCVLAGIRFRGGETSFPFVDIIASTAPWRSCVGRIRACIQSEFASFAPRAIRVLDATTAPSAAVGESIDQTFHAAAPVDMTTSPASGRFAAGEGPVQLEVVGGDGIDSCFDLMTDAYREFAEDDPEVAAHVIASDRDQLTECVETGLLCYVRDAGTRAGILGVAKSEDWLFEGLCVYDEILLRAHRGRGRAALAQVQLAQLLIERGHDELVWGTIADQNRASRKTALDAGRAAHGAFRFIALRADASD